jgi:hypothetical protein
VGIRGGRVGVKQAQLKEYNYVQVSYGYLKKQRKNYSAYFIQPILRTFRFVLQHRKTRNDAEERVHEAIRMHVRGLMKR